MDQQTFLTFLVLIFAAVFLVAHSLMVPSFGSSGLERKRLRQRLGELDRQSARDQPVSLLRERHLKNLSPLERWLESLPVLQGLQASMERAGHRPLAFRLVLLAVGMGAGAGLFGWWLAENLWVALPATLLAGYLPFLRLKGQLVERLNRFEEQLPEALEVIARALRAGYPFNEALQFVATEMEAPIAEEFRLAFDEINFGADLRWALRGLVFRVPSLSLMAVVTSVLVQRETGGNLAETLQKISAVVRGRFRFQRRVRTLTAEARLSAWVLVLVPFVLFGIISLINPGYAMMLVKDPTGRLLALGALVFIGIGNLWIKKLLALAI